MGRVVNYQLSTPNFQLPTPNYQLPTNAMERVIIIGCGIIGATIAYELSCLNRYEISLLDRQAPAQDATGAALGVLMGVISQKVKGRAWRLREDSIRRYHRLIPELEQKTGLAIPHNRQGIVKLLSREEDIGKWQQLIDTRAQQQWQLELWDKSQIREKLPHLDLDRVEIESAIYSPQDLQIQPIALTNALVAGAQLQGVNLHFNREVRSIESSSPNSWEVRTTREVMTADWVIITAGVGSTHLTQTIGDAIRQGRRCAIEIRPVLGQATHYRLPQPLGNRDFQPVITYDDAHIVPCVLAASQNENIAEYWVGATVEFPPHNSNDINPDPELLVQVQNRAIAFCPGLAAGEIIRTWSGYRPRPENRPAPVIERLSDRVLLATGHYRNGILLAPATADLIREMAFVTS